MSRHALRVLPLAAIVATLAFIPIAGHRASAAAPGSTVGPKAYYLALGDSLAYGFQPNLDMDAGYAVDFAANLQAHNPTTTLVDMGCTGETTVTFINGGCPYRSIFSPHYSYNGPQLQAALNFIQQHPGQVSPVTIDIGANDFLNILDHKTCTFTGNVTQTVQTIATNFQSILSQLKTALNGTGDLITMTYYFPYQNACPGLVPIVQELNAVFAGIARYDGALVAPVFATFGGAHVPNPALCSYTWICQQQTYLTCLLIPSGCIHATTLGYQVMAATIEWTAGY